MSLLRFVCWLRGHKPCGYAAFDMFSPSLIVPRVIDTYTECDRCGKVWR